MAEYRNAGQRDAPTLKMLGPVIGSVARIYLWSFEKRFFTFLEWDEMIPIFAQH
jgi:hypothetical protein